MNNEYYYRNRAINAEHKLAQMRRDAGYSDPAADFGFVLFLIFAVIAFIGLSNMFFTWIFGSDIALVITIFMDAFFLWVAYDAVRNKIKSMRTKNK